MLLEKIKIFFLNLKLKNQIEKKYKAKITSHYLYVVKNYLSHKGILKQEDDKTTILEYILNNGWVSPARDLIMRERKRNKENSVINLIMYDIKKNQNKTQS